MVKLPVRRRIELVWVLALLLGTRWEVLRLRRQVARMSVDPTFGCLTRQGAERRVGSLRGPREVVFFDIDGLHTLNARLGYAEVDRRIRAALTAVQLREDDLIMGRWYSGDELFAVVPAGTGTGLWRRLERALAEQGLIATCAVVAWQGSLVATIAVAAEQVRVTKAGATLRPCQHEP